MLIYPMIFIDFIANRWDGAVLHAVVKLGNRARNGRTVWTAVVLTAEEAAYVHRRGVNAAHETAAKLWRQFPKKNVGGSS